MGFCDIKEKAKKWDGVVINMWKTGKSIDAIVEEMLFRSTGVATRIIRGAGWQIPYLGGAENYRGMNICNYSDYSKQK